MSGYHFISYSSADGVDLAERIHRALEAGEPPFSAWRYDSQVRAGQYWASKVAEALKTCASLLFVMTPDSVSPRSECEKEWSRALRYKKPVVPLLCDRTVEVPLRLEIHQYIDFTVSVDLALDRLREHLQWLQSPEGILQQLRDRLGDAQRAIRRCPADQRPRIEEEILQLEEEIRRHERILADPQGAHRQTDERVEEGLKRESQAAEPALVEARRQTINRPPGVAPAYFQNRGDETKLIAEFLRDDARRVMVIVGRGGVGKTAMVCRFLKGLETGELPDGLGQHGAAGVVYLSAAGPRRVDFPTVFADLAKLLAPDRAEELDAVYINPQLGPEAKMYALLAAFERTSAVLLLDGFEDLVDPETREISDEELEAALRAVLTAPPHGLKVIITTRLAPRRLALAEPARHLRVDLEKGLPTPYAENVLRAMDVDGRLGLQAVPDELLAEACRRSGGYPRALEALFAILSTDRETTLEELLADTEKVLPDYVVEKLVGEAYHRLDDEAQKVMQALAVFGRPVPSVAVDYLLQPYITGVDSERILTRLVNMQFARRETRRCYLHPVDRQYALERVPKGTPADRMGDGPPPFTRFALWHRGAEYFRRTRRPPDALHTIDDLAPQRDEFDLLIAGEDYETAAALLVEIDMRHLFAWGHYRLMVQMHGQLEGKLQSTALAITSMANVGSAYAKMGQLATAIQHQKRALQLARESHDRRWEGDLLNRLGLRYHDLGQTRKALDLYRQSFEIAKEMGSPGLAVLINSGRCYADLGEFPAAEQCFWQALDVARRHGQRSMECQALENLGHLCMDLDDLVGAIDVLSGAVRIADEEHLTQIRNWARWGLALAMLYMGEWAVARAACEQAREHRVPENDHRVAALLGQLLLLEGDCDTAHSLFTEAITKSDEILANCAQVYHALDCRGLALCGLGLCGEPSSLEPAIASFSAARQINRDAAVVSRVLRQLEAFSPADPNDALSRVLAAGGGR